MTEIWDRDPEGTLGLTRGFGSSVYRVTRSWSTVQV